jgi:hypothetical protein
MEWYWWVLIIGSWIVCGILAFVMEFRTNAAMRDNIDWYQVWCILLGPLWLTLKVWQWMVAPGT